LSAARWKLRRIGVRGVLHHGKVESNWSLLKGRWRNRYLDGAGELLRATFGRAYFFRAARTLRHLFMGLFIWLGLIGGVLLLPEHPWLLACTLVFAAGLIAIRALRTKSLSDAVFGQIVWQVTSLAMVRGFFTKPRDPREPVEYIVIT
jgi:hypothetical protein